MCVWNNLLVFYDKLSSSSSSHPLRFLCVSHASNMFCASLSLFCYEKHKYNKRCGRTNGETTPETTIHQSVERERPIFMCDIIVFYYKPKRRTVNLFWLNKFLSVIRSIYRSKYVHYWYEEGGGGWEGGSKIISSYEETEARRVI